MSLLVFKIVTNVTRSTQIGGKWLWFDSFFPPRRFISGCFRLSCVRFLHAFNSLFGSASTHYSAELQPALTRLNSQPTAPFFVKEIFFSSIFSVSREFVAVLFFWADSIQFRLKTEKRVDASSFSRGWLLIADALCTFLKSHLQVAAEMVFCAFDWLVSFLMWNKAFNQHFCWLMASDRQILININLKYQ